MSTAWINRRRGGGRKGAVDLRREVRVMTGLDAGCGMPLVDALMVRCVISKGIEEMSQL